jgi:hypothetical protein
MFIRFDIAHPNKLTQWQVLPCLGKPGERRRLNENPPAFEWNLPIANTGMRALFTELYREQKLHVCPYIKCCDLRPSSHQGFNISWTRYVWWQWQRTKFLSTNLSCDLNVPLLGLPQIVLANLKWFEFWFCNWFEWLDRFMFWSEFFQQYNVLNIVVYSPILSINGSW